MNPSAYRARDNQLTNLIRKKRQSNGIEVKYQSCGRCGWYIQYPKFSIFIGYKWLDAFNYISLGETE